MNANEESVTGRETTPEREADDHVCPEDTYCDTCDPAGLNTYNLGGW